MKIKPRRFSSLNTSKQHSLIKSFVNEHKNSQTQPDQNSIVKLSKILNTLQDDCFKRYNTEDGRYLSQQRYNNSQKRENSLQRTNAPLQQTQKQYQISPQPWYNQMQPLKSDQLRKIHNLSKSSYISFSNNQPSCPVRQNLSKTHHPPSNKVNIQALSQNFTYTNQQKAKYSLEYLIHEKKHRKMEKILKYKAHCKDRTVLKQEKIYEHSKFLIETLKKLSTSDYIQTENSHLNCPIGQTSCKDRYPSCQSTQQDSFKTYEDSFLLQVLNTEGRVKKIDAKNKSCEFFFQEHPSQFFIFEPQPKTQRKETQNSTQSSKELHFRIETYKFFLKVPKDKPALKTNPQSTKTRKTSPSNQSFPENKQTKSLKDTQNHLLTEKT